MIPGKGKKARALRVSPSPMKSLLPAVLVALALSACVSRTEPVASRLANWERACRTGGVPRERYEAGRVQILQQDALERSQVRAQTLAALGATGAALNFSAAQTNAEFAAHQAALNLQPTPQVASFPPHVVLQAVQLSPAATPGACP